VVIPGHAFLGFYLDAQHKTVAFLETTMLNAPGNPYRNVKPSQFGDSIARLFQADARVRQSAQLFDRAIADATNKYNSNLQSLRNRAPGYRAIDVAQLRGLGVQPINH